MSQDQITFIPNNLKLEFEPGKPERKERFLPLSEWSCTVPE